MVALAGLMAVVFLLPPSSATFTSQVNASPTIAASAIFPGQPKLISDKGPVFYHRMEDTQASTAGSAAADTMTSSAGVYGPLTNAPSLWWRFDETGTAAPFSDVSGSADTASINGTATAGVAGPMGSAVTLGNGASLSSALSPFRADRSFTMSVWVNIGSVVPSGSTRFGVLSLTGNSANTPNGAGPYARSDAMIIAESPANCPVTTSPCWAFGMAQNPQNAAVAVDYARSTTAVAASTWVNLTTVYDTSNSTMSLYVNGVLDGTKSHTVATGVATNTGLDAGRFRDTTWLGTTGGTAQIGETRTWRRAVPATDITQLVVRPNVRYAFTEGAGTSTTYTTTANSTGAPGAVSRSSALATSSGATLAAGREGNAFSAGPSLGYLMGPNSQLTTTSSFTVSAWVKVTDTSVDKTFYSANYGAGTVVSVGIAGGANPKWTMGVLSGLTTYPITGDVTPVVANQWVHLVAVHDDFNNFLRLYVDGVPQTPVAFNLTPANANGPNVIGAKQQLGIITDTWSGFVDDLRLYSGYPLNTNATTAATVQAFVNQQNPALSAETPGGLQGTTKTGHAGSTAVAFGGTGNGYNNKYAAANATTAFTVECLIRVAAGQSGVIAGFTNTATGLGSTAGDRMLYVDSAGKVRFGVLNAGAPVTLVSAANVDDGAWHHITASIGPITGTGAIAAGGFRLSLDGTVVSSSSFTAATATTGVWRWGGAPFLSTVTWPAAPNNPYLTGTLDELAVYDKQLTDQDDLWRVYGNY